MFSLVASSYSVEGEFLTLDEKDASLVESKYNSVPTHRTLVEYDCQD